jgi:CO/xanthine dehydrogenase FAD-binding subunit
MRAFKYSRPDSLGEAVALLEKHGPDAQMLAGGTDLVIGLRDGWIRADVVVDVKRIPELAPGIWRGDGALSIGGATVMTEIENDELVLEVFPALAEAARTVGSVQIRNRATLIGNICNASPAADTAPPLLVYAAVVSIAGPDGVRKVSVDDFIVGPGKTDLNRGELVTSIELPMPTGPYGSAYTRMTRRRGTDLASVTLSCGVGGDGTTRLAYGSVGPRPFLAVDDGELAHPETSAERRAAVLDAMFERARPSLTSLRASPDYRLAMLRVLGARALQTARDRLRG